MSVVGSQQFVKSMLYSSCLLILFLTRCCYLKNRNIRKGEYWCGFQLRERLLSYSLPFALGLVTC